METQKKEILEWLKKDEGKKLISRLLLFLFLAIVNFYWSAYPAKIPSSVYEVLASNFILIFLFHVLHLLIINLIENTKQKKDEI